MFVLIAKTETQRDGKSKKAREKDKLKVTLFFSEILMIVKQM